MAKFTGGTRKLAKRRRARYSLLLTASVSAWVSLPRMFKTCLPGCWACATPWPQPVAPIRTWFFASDVTTVWPGQKLREGEAVRAFEFKQLASLDMPSVMYQTLERFHRQIRGECEN